MYILHIDVIFKLGSFYPAVCHKFGSGSVFLTDAAGNFLCPAAALSFNAFKTVMEIDTMGTFNTSKVVYEKWFQVH